MLKETEKVYEEIVDGYTKIRLLVPFRNKYYILRLLPRLIIILLVLLLTAGLMLLGLFLSSSAAENALSDKVRASAQMLKRFWAER